MKEKLPQSISLGQAQVNTPIHYRGLENQWGYKVAMAYLIGSEMPKLMDKKYFDIHQLFKSQY